MDKQVHKKGYILEKFCEIEYLDLKENIEYNKVIEKVIDKCFEIEELTSSKMYISVTLTNPENIRKINLKYRTIDKETDVLSFPMFEKKELEIKKEKNDFQNYDVLGDMVISIPKVKEQAKEYGHSFERELAYMVVHSFYHLLGYDHIEKKDKQLMREKEEFILDKLQIKRK